MRGTKRFMSLKELTLMSREEEEWVRYSVAGTTTIWLPQPDEHIVTVHPESALSPRHVDEINERILHS